MALGMGKMGHTLVEKSNIDIVLCNNCFSIYFKCGRKEGEHEMLSIFLNMIRFQGPG
jgi:hypothetical protein